jgi:uncharacterized protein YbcI
MDLAKFSKSKNGKGPESTSVEIFENVVLCIFEGFLTRAEEIIAESGNPENIFMNRVIYVNKCKDELEEIIEKHLHRKIKYLFPSYIPQKQIACWTIFLD